MKPVSPEFQILLITIAWLIIALMVSSSGKNKKVGYWGVFWIMVGCWAVIGFLLNVVLGNLIIGNLVSGILSLVIGGIVGSSSPPKGESKQQAPKWKCTNCGFGLVGMPESCSNCKKKVTYPKAAYDNVLYTCNAEGCGGKFYGRKDNCPHCGVKFNWS